MVASGAAAQPTLEAAELQERYAAYRRRQAARLIHLMPRDAVRPLYRRVRMAAGATEDPMELLLRYCEELLPLPPIDVWAEDLRTHPEAHLEDVDESAQAPTAQAPATVEVRSLQLGDAYWLARLRTYRDGGVWRGYIAFANESAGLTHRTAPVFCEDDPVSLRQRFLAFELPAVEAFLRSALP